MKILEDANAFKKLNIKKWKVQYLMAENKWMSSYLSKISTIILKYQSAIKHSTTSYPNQLLAQTLKSLDQQYAKVVLFGMQNDQMNLMELESQLFLKIIQSHYTEIKMLINLTTKNQLAIQKIENTLNKDKNIGWNNNPKTILKTINDYDIYYEIVSIYKRSIGNLKSKKKYLSMKAKENGNENTFDNLTQQSTRQLIKEENSHQSQKEKNNFDKCLIIYKKKKLSNQNKIKRNEVLKNKIKQITYSISKMQTTISNKIHEQFDVTLYNQIFQEKSFFNELTIVQKSFIKSFSFDKDFSKIPSNAFSKQNIDKLSIVDQIYNN